MRIAQHVVEPSARGSEQPRTSPPPEVSDRRFGTGTLASVTSSHAVPTLPAVRHSRGQLSDMLWNGAANWPVLQDDACMIRRVERWWVFWRSQVGQFGPADPSAIALAGNHGARPRPAEPPPHRLGLERAGHKSARWTCKRSRVEIRPAWASRSPEGVRGCVRSYIWGLEAIERS